MMRKRLSCAQKEMLPNMKFPVEFIPAILLAIILSSCATKVIPDYPKTSVDTYKNSMTIENLQLAAKAITDKEELEKFFGEDLSAQGIIPIHIVAENKNTLSSFLISKNNVILIDKSKKNGGMFNNEKFEINTPETSAWKFASLLSPVLAWKAMKATSDAAVFKHNLIAKEFQSRTISPGQSIDGFVYLSFKDGQISLNDWQLSVKASNLDNNGFREFILNLY